MQYAQPEETIVALKAIKPHLLLLIPTFLFLLFSKYDFLQWQYTPMKVFWLFLLLLFLQFTFVEDTSEGMHRIRYLLTYSIFMVSLVITTDTKDRLKLLNLVLILVAVFLCTRGIITKSGEMFSRNGIANNGNYFSDPNHLSLYLNMMIPFAYFTMLRMKTTLKRSLCLAALILFVVGVFLTYSRGGLLGMIGVFGMIWLFSPNKKRLFIISLGFMILVAFMGPKSWNEEVAGTALDATHSTADIRLMLWEISWDIFTENPIVGVGAGMVPYEVSKHIEPFESHSLWFTSLAETGIIGFMLLVTLIWYIIRTSYIIFQTSNNEVLRYFSISCLIAIVGCIISGSFITINYMPHIWYWSVFVLIAQILFVEETKGKRKCLKRFL